MLSIALTIFLESTVGSLHAEPSDRSKDKDHKEKLSKVDHKEKASNVVTTPEPATLALLGIGAGVVGAAGYIRKRFRR